ncbi:MAG: ornithine carbamoyltransferase [Leptospiraceae bacterium]|nr:MAG: ornithine carbamoyltransferase [Leptospiraceae bacterium]
MRHLLHLMNLKQDEFFTLLKRGIEFKNNRLLNPTALKNKSIALLFEKASTRTRISFSIAIQELGGHYLVLHANELQLGRGETIEDTTYVLSRYLDGIMIRTNSQKKLETMANLNVLPVINGLSDLYHPCQALADYMTIYDLGMPLDKIKIAFIGEPNNVFNSLVLGSIYTKTKIAIACPDGFDIHPIVKNIIKQYQKEIEIYKNPKEAVKNANVIYTDVWVSMGQEKEAEIRKKVFQPYSVNKDLLQYAPDDVIVMHCLPAHRGEEITDEVMDQFSHIIFQQAENRLHIQKAILEWIFGLI